MLIPYLQLPPVVKYSPDDVDLRNFFNFIDRICILGNVLLNIDSTWDRSIGMFELTKIVQSNPMFMSGFIINDVETAGYLLDKGLRVAFFTATHRDPRGASALAKLPRTRVGISCVISMASAQLIVDTVETFYSTCAHFIFRLPSDITSRDVDATIEEAKSIAAYRQVQIYFISSYASPDDAASVANNSELIHSVIYPKYFVENEHGGLMPAATPYCDTPRPTVDYVDAFVSCLQSDREDKLIATVVCDETGHCLGLVYSSDESLRVAFEKRQGVYWSRSQQRVWKKGDNSGCWQELLAIKHDCDGDALMFTVIQHGTPPAFCHLLVRSCWGPSTGIRKLEHLLKSRLVEAPDGSYTKRLFEDKDLLKRKLLVEANELFDHSSREHVAAEAADLMYFLMTRCISVGVGLRDIEANLDRRTLKINRPRPDSILGHSETSHLHDHYDHNHDSKRK